eukprot:4785507-Alexandrium_andersonii.AAC.1
MRQQGLLLGRRAYSKKKQRLQRMGPRGEAAQNPRPSMGPLSAWHRLVQARPLSGAAPKRAAAIDQRQ